MREVVCLSEPSSPADFHPIKPIIKPFRSLQEIPYIHGQNKVISALKGSGNTVSMANEHFSISKLPVKIGKAAASNSSAHFSTPVLNRAFSYTTTPPRTHPLALKHSFKDIGTKVVKRSDSQSTPSKTGSPKHQLTPIPLLSTIHEQRFIFPDVPCDSDSNLNQPEILMHNTAQNINDCNNSETMLSRYSASITPAPRKRKMSSVSVEMDPILEEEDSDGAELLTSSCVVDDVKSHSSASNSNNNGNAILDAAAVSRSHGQLPVVRVELTTVDLDCCMNSSTSPKRYSKTETPVNSCVVATSTTTAQLQTMQSPHKPNMVAEQHASTHCCSQPQGYSNDDDSIKNTLYVCEQQMSPPAVARQLQHDSTHSCSHKEDYKRKNSLHEVSSPLMHAKLHDNANFCCSQKHKEDGSVKDNLHDHKQPRPHVIADSPQTHREGCKSKEQISSPVVAKQQHGCTLHCSPQTLREDSRTDNTLHEQPHPPPSEVMTTGYDCSTANGARAQKGMPYPKDINSTPPVGFSHNITHREFNINETGVHSRSLGNDTARTRCKLQSKTTTENAGGSSMVHSKEVIACEQLQPMVASHPKEARCVVAGGQVGLETEYNNGKESNSTPPQQGKEPDNDLCHGPCSQASSHMQHKSKHDHPPASLKFDQQNQGTLQTSLHDESMERRARNKYDYDESKSGVQRWRQQNIPPVATISKPLVSEYVHQPGSCTVETKFTGSNAPIDSEKSTTHKQSKQEGQGPGLTLIRRSISVVKPGQPRYIKQNKLMDTALSLNKCPSGHNQTIEGSRSIDGHSSLRSRLQQGGTCISECRIPRRICTSVQIGSPEATTRDGCNYYGNRRGNLKATDGHIGKKTLPVGSVNRGSNNRSQLAKQELRSQLTTAIPNIGFAGQKDASLLPKQTPKAHVGLIRSQNERGVEGKGEDDSSDWPINEATSRTLVPASTTACFNTALKMKGDDHDQASTNENPTLIRLPSVSSDVCTALSCSHEPMPVPTVDQVRNHSSRGIRAIPAGNSNGKNEQQTKCCDKISPDYEKLRHDLNTAGIQHHGNAGNGAMHNYNEGGVPGNHGVEGCMLPPQKLQPKMVAMLHKTTPKFTPRNTSRCQAQFSSGGCEKKLPETTRKLDSKSNFKVDNHPTVIDITTYKIPKTSRNEDQIVHTPRGTNYSSEQESHGELETVSTYPSHPISCNIPEATSSNPGHAIECPSLSNNGGDGLVPVQHKSSGMCTHTFSHPPDALPNAVSRESEQNNLRKAINVDNGPPTKTGKINHNSVSGSIHVQNCPAGQPSVRRVGIDYANMTTCSRGPLPVVANSKLKSLKPLHPNKQRAKLDHPSPIKYMQTDI